MTDDTKEQPPLRESSAAASAPAAQTRGSEPGAAALTIGLWLLLADAAVETFSSGAPVRWWVAGVVAAYLGLAVVVRRRVSWGRQATAAVFVLLGLLADRLVARRATNGVVMLRQPTPAVLSAVSALAVAVAGLVLVRLKVLPCGAARLSAFSRFTVSPPSRLERLTACRIPICCGEEASGGGCPTGCRVRSSARSWPSHWPSRPHSSMPSDAFGQRAAEAGDYSRVSRWVSRHSWPRLVSHSTVAPPRMSVIRAAPALRRRLRPAARAPARQVD